MDLHRQIQGTPDDTLLQLVDEPGLIQSISLLQQKFCRAIRSTAPKFIPFEKSASTGKQPPKAELYAIKEEDEREEAEDADGSYIYIDEVLERATRCPFRLFLRKSTLIFGS